MTTEARIPPRVSRRRALGALASGVAGVWSLANAMDSGAAGQPIVRTLLGDLVPSRIKGAILFHEHLSGTTKFSDDVSLMVNEAVAAQADGIGCIVDGGHPDFKFSPSGYRIESLKRIARESGLPIVASGGYYNDAVYPPSFQEMSVSDIAENLARESRANSWGALGEIGQRQGVMSPIERKFFQAIGATHMKTGLPVFTHNAYIGIRPGAAMIPPEAGLRQLDALESSGMAPQHIAIGHMCCLDDPAVRIAKQIAARGAYVGFDRVTLEGLSLPDEMRVAMVMALVDAGFASKLLLSSDFFDERSLKKNGGAGLGQAVTAFGPKLRAAGLPPETLVQITNDNPRRFLEFLPRL
jgi:phosphotriesterase-related protein